MSLTAPYDAPERLAEVVELPVINTTTIYAGNMVAIDANGNGVPASDTAGLRVAGRCQNDVVAGLEIFDKEPIVKARRGCFFYQNSATYPVAQANMGQICFVQDCQTVAMTTAHSVKAGIVLEINPTGVWVDCRNTITG